MKLKRFVINDLFGYQTVDIPFDKNIKVLVGENGLGKTTVLNTLYFVLSRKFDRLLKVPFSSIELHLDSKKKIIINKTELGYYLDRNKNKNRSHFTEIIAKSKNEQKMQLKAIIDGKQSEQSKRLELQRTLHDIGIRINAPTHYIYDLVTKYFAEEDANNFLKVVQDLDAFIDFKILYFPTYRRIEEELKNIGFVPRKEIVEKYGHHFFDYEEEIIDEEEIEKKTIDDDIIQFGMQDVDDRIKNLTKEIARSSLSGFSEITGQMLHQLLTEFPEVKGNRGVRVELNKLQIILDRVGPSISLDDKQQIVDFIKSGKATNKGLIYFINKLIELYNKQESIDTSIKTFVNVCNGYLKGKKYFYDEREVSLKIKRERKDEEVFLNQLSSGEKQIVSLFSKIYLEQSTNYIVLFDEPELSLSIFWQQKLLPDILNSKKCSFLVAVTHSPFIYDNELATYAIGLSEYIKFRE